jgi:hypothetical protein
MKNNLAEKWEVPKKKTRVYNIPTTVRLRPSVVSQIQDILYQFPHLTMAQVINDLLEDALHKYNQSL